MADILKIWLQRLKPTQRSLGIEITDRFIKIAEVHRKPGQAGLIAALQLEPLPKGAVDSGSIKDAGAVALALQAAYLRMNTKVKEAHLVMNSQSVMIRFLKLPDIALHDLGKLIDFEVKHNIHFPFDNPVYDHVKLNGSFILKQSKSARKKQQPSAQLDEVPEEDLLFAEAAPGKEAGTGLGSSISLFGDIDSGQGELEQEKKMCDVLLTAAPRAMIEQYMQVVQSVSKLKVKSIEIKALSLLRLMQHAQLLPEDAACLSVDINDTSADLSIFHNGQLKITRSIPVSMENAAVQRTMLEDSLFSQFMNPEAEFQSSCNDLAHEIERLMNFYRYSLNHRDQQFQQIYLSGDVERLSDAAAIISDRLSLPVHVLYSELLQSKAVSMKTNFPIYAVPIGLALRGGEA